MGEDDDTMSISSIPTSNYNTNNNKKRKNNNSDYTNNSKELLVWAKIQRKLELNLFGNRNRIIGFACTNNYERTPNIITVLHWYHVTVIPSAAITAIIAVTIAQLLLLLL